MRIVNEAPTNRTISAIQAILVAGLWLLTTTQLAVAQSGNPPAAQATPVVVSDDEVNRLASRMYCPVCENVPLDVCPTQACAQWRELIREKLALGWDDQAVIAYFADQYGDRVLAEPPLRGLNWLVYILPVLALVIALMRVGRMFSAARQAERSPLRRTGPAGEMEDAYLKRIEDEIRRYEER